MSELDRTALKAKIDANISNSGNRETTGDLIREVLKDMADSHVNKDTDGNLLAGLADYDTGKTYIEGEGCFYDGTVYRANKETTGTWKPGDWDGTWPIALGGMINADVQQSTYGNAPADEVAVTHQVVSNVFVANGQVLRIKAFGTFASNTNAKTIEVLLDSNVAFQWNTTQNGGDWAIEVDLVVNDTNFKAYGEASDGSFDIRTVSQNPVSNFQAKLNFSAVANGDIVSEGSTCEKIGTLT